MLAPVELVGSSSLNWEALGAIGELVGATGVILSLVYLGLQIRHSSEQTNLNTRSVQATAYQNLIDHHTSLNLNLAYEPELFELLMRAEFEGLDNLSLLEQNRWEVFMVSTLRSYLNGYYLREGGLITEEQWQNFSFGLGTTAGRPAFSGWWHKEKQRRGFPDGFVRIVDAETKRKEEVVQP